MADGSTFPSSIGPATEGLISRAFASTILLSTTQAAHLLGMDTKTLDAMADAGAIRAVRRGGGQRRGYTERDIRAYLTDSPGPERGPKAKVTHPAGLKVVPFSQRKGARPGR